MVERLSSADSNKILKMTTQWVKNVIFNVLGRGRVVCRLFQSRCQKWHVSGEWDDRTSVIVNSKLSQVDVGHRS